MSASRLLSIATALFSIACAQAEAEPSAKDLHLGVKKWQILERESGPVDYYEVVADPQMPFIRAHYKPPTETAVLGYQIPDGDRQRARLLHWKWRVHNLPPGGDECVEGKGDSAAGVYLVWKGSMRVYTLKYVWSTVGQKGAVCDRKRSAFVARDKIILESGPPIGDWKDEELDLKAEFRR
ncbi:MAG TPA: DUF3047 domain-containing protein, partial [Haliangiales bacterium]|nr:DUF3047 domain-containing protein [Haliangiales bacterium]